MAPGTCGWLLYACRGVTAAPSGTGERLLSRFPSARAATFLWWGKAPEVWRQRRNGSDNAALHSPQWGVMMDNERRCVQGARVGKGNWVMLCLVRRCIGATSGTRTGVVGEGEVWRGPHTESQRGSTERGGMYEWSIAEALPGTAAYEAMYTLYGGWTERG
ncbi:hypothetical protein B0H14DRAFT_3480742 [Mycena olivaceomarginata]|nr:hypothetical protein B0H14DRAFT_3480742 [Mycena olivaceomarginata]